MKITTPVPRNLHLPTYIPKEKARHYIKKIMEESESTYLRRLNKYEVVRVYNTFFGLYPDLKLSVEIGTGFFIRNIKNLHDITFHPPHNEPDKRDSWDLWEHQSDRLNMVRYNVSEDEAVKWLLDDVI